MAKYKICFIQYYSYKVEAETEDEAFDLAYEEFDTDTHRPIANNFYDEVEIEEIEEDE